MAANFRYIVVIPTVLTMDRREFLTGQHKKVRRSVPEATYRTHSGLNSYTGPWTANEVQHLLKRTLFGSTREDIAYFRTRTVSQAVTELLNPSAPLPAPPVNDYNSATTTDPTVAAGQTWINSPTSDGAINSQRRASFKRWWTGVMLNQDRSIREKLTLFWANHFATESNDISNAHWVYWHHALLRQQALGNFKQLVKAVTIDAGMLRYLNGYLNSASAPDENYARELQELFTVGKDLTPHYTEDDVRKAAKVLTGWRINNSTFASYFDPARHDSTPKQFSTFYNSTTIAGRTGAAGANETDDLITMIFNKEEVSRHLCRKLYRWFVYYKIDAATEANVIEPLALLFRQSNYEIRPVLSVLLQSEHFFDVLNQGCQIKSPVDHVIGCMREFGVRFPDRITEYADASGMWNYIRGWLQSMTQDLADPPSVSGWPAYYQVPMFYEIWINSDTLPKRNRFTDTLISSGYSRNGKRIIIDAVAFVKTFSNPADPNALIDEALSIIYRVPLSAQARQQVKQQILLSSQTRDQYWTDAWNAHIANPGNTANYNIVNTRLKALFQYFMSQAEYQLA
jgi:uncharacterized protein (DUF1800 family)